ncbi:MAG: hypothetical protein IPG23_13180 [Burkholderiales bacterium]|nr:hypothetical protein [Burkholderiales bacterium]
MQGAIAPALDIPEGKKGIDWLDVFVLPGQRRVSTLGSVEEGAASGSVKER